MSTVRANTYLDATGGSNAVFSGVASPPNSMGFRNRILNGDCRIDQRNNGASVTANNNVFPVDRFYVVATQTSRGTAQRNAGGVTPPSGFVNYLGFTSSSAYSVLTGDAFALRQSIEGFNVSDLGWGTASAQSITVSFWVRSSLTGSFGGNAANSAFNRSYPFSYTINAANTWEYKTVTIPGDTTGTWLTDNNIGVALTFGLGYGASLSGTANAWNAGTAFMPTGATSVVGTNGATWFITGVQLEAGTVASPFERRDYGRELLMCQRYFETYALLNTSLMGNSYSVNAAEAVLPFKVTKRALPTITLPAAGQTLGTVGFLTSVGGYPASTGTNSATNITVDKISINGTSYSGLTQGSASSFYSNGASTIQISAEL